MRQLFLILILVLTSLSQAQRVLHISTIPSNADVYIGEIHPDLADKPDCTSPAFIKVSEEQNLQGEVLIHLFHPEFNDTTIRVKLSNRDTSFLVVSLRPTYDDILLDEQQRILGKRSRRVVGKKLMIASAIPFLAGGISSLITLYYINQADDAKNKVERIRIKENETFTATLDEFHESRENAKTARTATLSSLAIGTAFLAIGFAISF